jgi:hypothetical protein
LAEEKGLPVFLRGFSHLFGATVQGINGGPPLFWKFPHSLCICGLLRPCDPPDQFLLSETGKPLDIRLPSFGSLDPFFFPVGVFFNFQNLL